MNESQEIDSLRKHWHDVRDVAQATSVTVAVLFERQAIQGVQLDRIEATLTKLADKAEDYNARLIVMETRASDAATSGAKWGGTIGGVISALIAGLAAAFRGGQ